MACIDYENEVSDAQAVTATALSTNVINMNSYPQYAAGEDLFMSVMVNTTFAGGTSLRAVLWTDDTTTVTSGADIISGDVLTVANNQLDAGKKLLRVNLKDLTLQQYVGVQFVVVGTMTAGKIDAYLETTPNTPPVTLA
jgi:hypothetical protein